MTKNNKKYLWQITNNEYTREFLKKEGYLLSFENIYLVSHKDFVYNFYKFLIVDDRTKTYTLSTYNETIEIFDIDENELINITNKIRGAHE